MVVKGLAGIGAAAVGMAAAAIKVGSDFTYQMSRVQAIAGATGKEYEKLKAQAIDLGAKTAFSAQEAAQGMENLASAGFNTSEIMAAMPGIMDLAAVSGGDIALASENAASALRAFELDASQAAHVSDVFARAAADTNAEVYDMGEAMKYVAPNAATAGIALEETAAAIGIMSDAGVKGSQAGTTLRTALVNMAKPTDKMIGKMEELGLEFFDMDGNMVSLEEQVRQLETAFAHLTPEQRQNALATLYGKEALSGMTILVNRGSEELKTLTTSLENSTGAAAEMAKVMQDNLTSDVEQMGGALESLGIQIFSHMEQPLRQAAQEGEKAVNRLATELAKPNMQTSLNKIGEGFSSLVKVIGNVVTSVIPPLVQGLSGVITVATALSPVLIAGATAFGAYVIIGQVSASIQGFKTALDAAGNAVKTATTLNTLLTTALGAEATAETVRTAAKSAGMTVDAAGNLITAAGATATTAETAAVLLNSGALSAKTVIMGVLSGSIGITTAAQWLWNAAMMANPIGAVIAALVILVGVIALVVKAIKGETEEQKALKKQTEETVESNKKLKDSLADNSEAYNENVKAMNADYAAAEMLTDKIYDLSQAENMSAADKRVLKLYVDELNESMGEAILQYDEETGVLTDSTGAVVENTDAVKALIGERQSLAENEVLIERERELIRELVLLEEELDQNALAIKDLDEALEAGTISQYSYNSQTKELKASGEELQAEVEERTATIERNSEKIEENAAIQMDAAVNVSQTWVAMNGEIMASQDAMLDRNKELMEMFDEYVGSVTSMHEAISETFEMTAQEQLAILDENYKASQRFTENLNTLMEKGLDEGIVQTWREQGLASAGEVATWANATEEEIQALNEKMSRNIEEGARGAGESLQLVAEDAMDGFIIGVDGRLAEVEAAGVAAGEAVTAGTKGSLDSNSPSKVYIQIGKDTLLGMEQGITAQQPSLIKVMTDVIAAMLRETTTGITNVQTEFKSKFSTTPQLIYNELLPAVQKVIEWGNQMKNTAQTAATEFNTMIETELKKLPQKVYEAIQPAIEKVKTWGTQIKTEAKNAVSEFNTTVETELKKLPPKVKTELDKVLTEVKSWVTSLKNTAKTEIPSFVTTATAEFEKMKDPMPKIGVQIVEGLWSGMNSKLGWFKDQIASFVRSAVRTMKDELDINSPSRVTEQIGMFTAEGFIVGIQKLAAKVDATVEDVFNKDKYLTREFVFATGAIADNPFYSGEFGKGDTVIHQHIETIPMTPYEMAEASKTTYDQARWEE